MEGGNKEHIGKALLETINGYNLQTTAVSTEKFGKLKCNLPLHRMRLAWTSFVNPLLRQSSKTQTIYPSHRAMERSPADFSA